MIRAFVDSFLAQKALLKAGFREKHPGDYKTVVSSVIRLLSNNDFGPDPDRIHAIDDGDYQGTLVFVIGAQGYQPSTYWYVKVSYGSCSGCDTLQAIRDGYPDYDEEDVARPTEKQVEQYMTLALHIVQGLKQMGHEEPCGD